MFSRIDIDQLKQSPYVMIQLNHHDATIHSSQTGHDWIIVSNYETPGCYLLHRHSARDPYHRQRGTYKSLEDALGYIDHHEKWVINHKM